MADINEARQQMMEELQRKIQTDSKLSSIRNKIQNGDYSEASQYGVRSGEILSEVIRGNITEELFQQCDVKGLGEMLLPVIKQENQYVANAVSAAQKAQNAEAGIGIRPLQAENDLNSYFNIFGKMKSDAYDSFEQASWLLDEPIVHDSLSIVDDTLQENAEFQYKSGLKTCVIRDPEPDCCDWCAERAGTFYYPDVPDSVWERHNHCLCEIRIETEKDYAPSLGGIRANNNINRGKSANNLDWLLSDHKLKFKLDDQFFSGRQRADRYEKNWQKASATETVARLVPNPEIITYNEKTIFRSDSSKYMLIRDDEGGYFRIMDTELEEPGKRKYVALDGSDLNYYTDNEGNVIRRSMKEYEKLSHFKNSDGE